MRACVRAWLGADEAAGVADGRAAAVALLRQRWHGGTVLEHSSGGGTAASAQQLCARRLNSKCDQGYDGGNNAHMRGIRSGCSSGGAGGGAGAGFSEGRVG